MSDISRFSSLRERLDHVFLADKLRDAKSYKRIAGYFRSSILELVGEEIESIEDVRIVCNSDLDPADLKISKAARDTALKERWNELSPEVESLMHRDRYKKLYELLISGKVKIKVVPKDVVFLHGKAGVIEQADGSRTSFLGSINESRSAFAKNHEILWEDRSKEGCDWVEQEFEKLWAMGEDLPDAIITEVKRIGGRAEITFDNVSPEDLPAAVMVEAPIYRGGEQLQPWQQSFVATFLQHREIYGKARLLIADEVGLGKTLAMATSALVSALLGDGPVLILCPATLTLQWQTELKDRLGIPSGVWVSNQKYWVDPTGRAIPTRGAEDIARCPFQVAIVSTGLIIHQSEEAQILCKLKYGTLILDESHKARMRGGMGKDVEPNNLLAFMRVAAANARHVLLGTATPIQTSVSELWDLMSVLNQGADFVMGREYISKWQEVEKIQPLITGNRQISDEFAAWELLIAPLPSDKPPMLDLAAKTLFKNIRMDLGINDKTFHTDALPSQLQIQTRSFDLAPILGTDFFKRNNPFVRHVVLRRRKSLEDAGLLEKIEVNVHPQPNALPGTYRGVQFDGIGLITNRPFEIAYEAADGFVSELSKRTKGAKLLRSIFLQRICSSFESGRSTVQRILDKQIGSIDDDDDYDEEKKVLETLTEKEVEYLKVIKSELSRPEAHDPKLQAVRWFLKEFQSDDKSWADLGCIIFSQYYDTAKWVASELAKDFPDKNVAVYAGAGKSGMYKGADFVHVERDVIKKLVKTRDVELVVATDAACEGLNLQTLGTLINIDLPWNPSKLEQRLGRIKRFGQARKSVDMLNLTYQGTRDEDVYKKISERMKDRFDIFGGIPDCIDDDWIEDFEKFEELADTHLHMRKEVTNIFEETWGKTVKTEDKWEECTRVLSRKDIESVMSTPWGKRFT